MPKVKKEQPVDDLYALRHSLAHVLAQAVQKLWPSTQITIGPPIDTGCYYDFLFSEPITDADFPAIEKEMRRIIADGQTFKVETHLPSESIAYWKKHGQPFKVELVEDLMKEGEGEVTHYISVSAAGEDMFTDLCRGGHVTNLRSIPPDAFKITSLAGAYWRGNEKNPQLTRIYVAAFKTKAALEEHLKMVEEAKKRDHRKLGEELNLFHFDELIGKGLPMWLPKGNIIKEELERWAKETEEAWGYQRVTTPIITKEELFHISGHLPLYKDSMYAPIQIEDETYYIKPMNCPFHHRCFAARPKSYRDLPVRYAEYGWCHRYEDSGSLFGLMRVRGMQMNDAHIYIQKECAVEEFVSVIRLHEYYYKMLGIANYEMELSLRDPHKMEKYHGDESDWIDAEKMTIEAMKKSGVPYKVVHEGAAFYGPKMDFQIYSSIGRMFSASTNQLDLYMGKRFKLEYRDRDGQLKTPVVIHRAPLGTHERFIGFLIEHFAGHFPLWLAPVQAAILPVAQPHEDAALKIAKELKEHGIRAEYFDSTESLGKRIREGEKQRIPYLLVVGDKEVKDHAVSVRNVLSKEQVTIAVKEFVKKTVDDIAERRLKCSIG
ncbi:TPA: threonine--tRNA ligase [Candidatus Peribacteria bacterium]|nr:MAG: threonine--tRNA ligase [Candidatus Peribacteria bacterium RIFOXYD2_FULL_58_15]HAI98885.1 threonine--tRNA ligase [Candidatus Peribacteria bacterium]HAS33718.1 threonine--tRNA ligase [Candidatus Peribacteria bacterium]